MFHSYYLKPLNGWFQPIVTIHKGNTDKQLTSVQKMDDCCVFMGLVVCCILIMFIRDLYTPGLVEMAFKPRYIVG